VSPKSPRHRAVLSHALNARTRFELENDRPADAARTALELKKLWPGNGKELYGAARWLAHSVGCARKKQPPAEPGEIDRYADLAVTTLREAVAVGFHDTALLRAEPAFLNIKERRDFQDIVAALPGKVP
jgi:hypothetical protein